MLHTDSRDGDWDLLVLDTLECLPLRNTDAVGVLGELARVGVEQVLPLSAQMRDTAWTDFLYE